MKLTVNHVSALAVTVVIGALQACAHQAGAAGGQSYLDYTGRDDVLSGGVKMIPIRTPAGTFRVWTKRIGNNPSAKVLLLHGGPGFTHEYLEAFDSYLPGAGIEYYYYDQLGSAYSDQPDAPELWELPRFVEEVEQVRQALGLDRDDFYLYGNSWGGLLAIEYALKYQQHLKGLIISSMMSSIPAYNAYAREVLMADMDPDVLAELERLEAAEDYDNPRYMELLMEHHYVDHILRMPAKDWPEPVNRSFRHLNPAVYIPLQGPSELGASGKLVEWDRTADLASIAVPTLVIGARYDTMDPAHMEWMAGQVLNGRFLYCPNGGHLAMYDDQEIYFDGLIRFIDDVERGRPMHAPGDEVATRVGHAGAIRDIMHRHDTAAHISLAELTPDPDLYAVGALSGLRGEITVTAGRVHISRATGDGSSATEVTDRSAQDAALLVFARVGSWVDVPIDERIGPDSFDARIEALAAAAGIPRGAPFPFLIVGPVADLRWHVIDGSRLPPGPGSHAEHMRATVKHVQDQGHATLVGFFSEVHEGIFTHMGSTTHVHCVLQSPRSAGHVDQVTVLPGATLFLPADLLSRTPNTEH